MNAREELERIICQELMNKNPYSAEFTKDIWLCWVKDITQKFLAKLPELGFVRLEDVEIDEDKLGIKLYLKSPMRLSPETARRIANAICQEKGILRVKEGK